MQLLQKANFDMQWMLEKEQEYFKPAFLACAKGDIGKLKEYVSKDKEGAKTATNSHSKGLLHVACDNGHSTVVEFLLMQGFNPNSRDKIL